MQITTIAWLRPPGQNNAGNLSKSDLDKRFEIFLEFVYWLFDSFLIPLIRTNFHVTESSAHRNRLFYFRHDIWRMLAEPALTTLRLNMFEELPRASTAKLLSARRLGFSDIRLLPKKQGFRTIMNLRRRQQVLRNGAMSLGRSINAVMTPAFNVITYEKVSILAISTGQRLTTRCSHYNLTSLALRYSRSETCFPSWQPSGPLSNNRALAKCDFILPKLTCKPALTPYLNDACCA